MEILLDLDFVKKINGGFDIPDLRVLNHRFRITFFTEPKLSCLTVVEIEQCKLENLLR